MEGKAQAVITTGGSLMHADEPQPDFSGWATKANLQCTDGRTIMPDAFKHQDKAKVPLVWQHNHDDPGNVLGHAILENRGADGVYAYGFFNDSENGKHAKTLVEHSDINALSIFANQLKEQGKNVLHGMIRELSLVMAGANPGALIDNLSFAHGDGEVVVLEDEAVIYTGLELEHESGSTSTDDGPSIQDVYDAMDENEKNVVHYMVGQAVEAADSKATSVTAAHTALPKKDTPISTNGKEGLRMSRNVFENNGSGSGSGSDKKHSLSHDDLKGIAADAMRMGSAKKAFEAYALAHGIENLDVLFPDAKTVTDTPEFDKRRTEWVSSVMNGTRHTPFSRIKSVFADITHDDARAKGYIKGTFKKEEWFGLAKRVTTPTTFYKKQKLDRDDIIDVTDIDVVTWLKSEMRLMLEEEFARAVLVGDGRDLGDEDKIRDPQGAADGAGIRSILHDHELYAAHVNVAYDETDVNFGIKIVEQVMLNMRFYKGSGSPTFYTTLPLLTRILLAKDGMGRRLWRTKSDLAAEMGVADIVEVEVMEDAVYQPLVGIIVNLKDYNVGTDRGGDITMFDDFDIDYNQYKYLIEGRASGALVKIRSALIINRVAAATVLVDPVGPSYNEATHVVTIPTDANVNYTNADTGAAIADGATVTVAAGTTLRVHAAPTAGHYFSNDQQDDWSFTREA